VVAAIRYQQFRCFRALALPECLPEGLECGRTAAVASRR
jgi:hypothetical protein